MQGDVEHGQMQARRIACVGDSITWGAFVWGRKRKSYPARLQEMLGERFVVGNFGAPSHTLQDDGDDPYRTSKAFRQSAAFRPDVVILMLGTNDAKGKNWHGAERFSAALRELIAYYQALASAPTVCLMTPPATFGKGRRERVRYGIEAANVEAIGGIVRDIAAQEGLDVVDVYAATVDHPEVFKFDGVHPQAAGAGLIAQAVLDVLGSRLRSGSAGRTA